MGFAQKSFIAMQVVVYIATVGAGGRKYRFHFPRYVRYVDFSLFSNQYCSILVCSIYALGILRRVTKDILRIRRGDYGLFKGKKDNEQVHLYTNEGQLQGLMITSYYFFPALI